MRRRAEVTSLFSALAYLPKHLTHGMQLFQKTNCKGLFSQRRDSQTQNTAFTMCDVLLGSAADTARHGAQKRLEWTFGFEL